MSNLQVWSWLFGEFDTILNSYVASTSSDIIGAITPVAYILFGIYIVLWGFSMVRGMIDEPVLDGLFRLVKIAIVLGFALSAGRYQGEIVTFFTETPVALANTMVFGSASATDGGATTAGALDDLVNKTIDTAGAAWDKMSFLSPGTAIGLAISAFIILAGGLTFTVAAGISILIAKIAMVLLLALGPIFIIMLMFKATQRFFEQWFHQVLNYMILLVLLLAIISLFLRMCEHIVTHSQALIDSDPLQAVALVLVVTISCTALIMNVPQIASALAGGLGLQTSTGIGRRLGGAAAGMGGSNKGGAAGKTAEAGLAAKTGGASAVVKAMTSLVRAKNTVSRG